MILDLLRAYQLDLMLGLSGACIIISLFVLRSKTIRPAKKRALALFEMGSALLLVTDRTAYLFRGDSSDIGFWMVRVSNFFVFFLTLVIIYAFNMYVIDLYMSEGGYKSPPRRLIAARVALVIGMILVIVSQFTGLYYTFDASNTYQRAPGFIVCYLVPIVVLLLQLSVFIKNRKGIRPSTMFSLLTFIVLPLVASLAQIFAYGISLINLTLPLASVLLYLFALDDLNEQAHRAQIIEIEYLKAEEREMRMMFEQTAIALASAIDAKDAYTNGHSTRVAEYARRIAELAGKDKEFCEDVYYAGLLHDVGKIGVPDAIINKNGKLTDEEYAIIKTHPEVGGHILESITQSPFLRIGARHHHERYDGRGYPDGLPGKDIPELARIIAVADAYDAMTSKRSYRDVMPQKTVREQIEQGLGTQFDPVYGRIMLRMIDDDSAYTMREHDDVTDDVTQ